MSEHVLVIFVAFVGACCALLVVLTLGARLLSSRRRRRALAIEPACRAQVEALVLEGRPPEPRSALERRMILGLALRQLDLLRGAEAEAITRYLDTAGFVGELVDTLHRGRPWRRAAAADALGRSRSALGVPALTEALSDDAEDVRLVAARSLALIASPAAVEALARAVTRPTGWALALLADDLVMLGSAALPALRRMVARDDPQTVLTAVRIMGEVGDPSTAPILTGLLTDSTSVDVRAQAVCALGKIGGSDVVPAVVKALTDPAWEVRAQAAKAAGRVGDPAAVPSLEAALPDESWWVRTNGSEALARLGDAGATALRRVAAGRDRYAAEQAAATLQRLDAGRADAQPTRARDSLRRRRTIAARGQA